jgi:hypothetical protein
MRPERELSRLCVNVAELCTRYAYAYRQCAHAHNPTAVLFCRPLGENGELSNLFIADRVSVIAPDSSRYRAGVMQNYLHNVRGAESNGVLLGVSFNSFFLGGREGREGPRDRYEMRLINARHS